MDLIDTLRRLSAVAQNGEDPGQPDEPVLPSHDQLAAFVGADGTDGGSRAPEVLRLRLLDTTFPDGDPRRIRFVHELANLAGDFHSDTADRIRRMFGLHVVRPNEPNEDAPPTVDQMP